MILRQHGPQLLHHIKILKLKKNLDEHLNNLLTSPWVPENTFQFPARGKRNLRFQSQRQTLESLSDSLDIETSSKALSFLKSTLTSEFVVSLCLLANILQSTISVYKILQSPYCDLKSAVEHTEDSVDHFGNIQRTMDVKFSKIFITAKALMSQVCEEIHFPRVAPHQHYRSNYSTKDPESYLRISVAIPIQDDLINQLKCRFSDRKDLLGTLQCFIPASTTETVDAEPLK
ncbi:hypothetical protein QYM36_015502 [Artemia franciscana]|uniref:Uncharacterized protein n=1 Tax=Artemia franciscana TaxID=6661 RepID=A0AA88HHZ3_ARTSF|nr:hypothetical protein QYM36_015502 [Artemia franciscana]